ncbi:MAG: LacI family DNA-binding transcriptional regulator CceR [Roseovarius sp.]
MAGRCSRYHRRSRHREATPVTSRDDRRTSPRPLTLRDVSEASGVSEMTVSRVLRNRGEVAEATRQKVLEAARSLGYVPNKIAGALASSRVNLVAVVIPSMSNMVFPEVMSGISEVLDETDLQPVIGITGYSPQKEERVLYEMLSWRPSGVILAGLEHSDASRTMLRASGIPVVEIMDADGTPIDSLVGISHRRAGRKMAEAILKQGYEHIAFLGTKMSLDHRARKRFEGFTEALAKAGIEIEDREFYSGGSALVKGREMTQAVLARSPDLDFIYYSNDLIGAGGLLWLLERGIEIPARIGLAGFNGLNLLKGLPRELATMDACRHEIGRKAAEIIARRVADGGEGAPERIVLEPRISYGDTLRRH